MSLLLSRLRLGKPRKSSLLLLFFSSGFSTWTAPCLIIGAKRCGEEMGRLEIYNHNGQSSICLEKKVPLELVHKDDTMVTIGASHGWIASLKEDGILRLQDVLNPVASDTDPKRIPLPPLVTLPHCQTRIVTNVSMSSSSPENDEECVVAAKFLGPQLSFCRPAASSEWTNIRIENPCFFSSRVMFSEGDGMFRIPGCGGHLIGSWDISKKHKHKIQRLRFQNLPELSKTKRELLHSCFTSEHLVESRTTRETFMVKWYRKTGPGLLKMKTKALMVFKIDEQGNAVYTRDIGDLVIYLSKSEPFCVLASSFPGLVPNEVTYLDVDEIGGVLLDRSSSIISRPLTIPTPYYIPPQTNRLVVWD